jgi:serine/threonine protein kinase
MSTEGISAEIDFISTQLIRHGEWTQSQLARVIDAFQHQTTVSSFIDYLIAVKVLNSFGARVLRAAFAGNQSIGVADVMKKLRDAGKLQVPESLPAPEEVKAPAPPAQWDVEESSTGDKQARPTPPGSGTRRSEVVGPPDASDEPTQRMERPAPAGKSATQNMPPPPPAGFSSTGVIPPLDPDEMPTSGVRVGGRFLLQEVLGEGASSIIYRAFHEALGVSVAVKVFKKQRRDPEAVSRFVREARILAQLDHSNIVRVIDVDYHGNTPYIVFEYVGAMSLEELITVFGPLDGRRICKIGMRLADGLAAAHHLGMIHRDIKPANILLRKNGQPKLGDFGLATLRYAGAEERGQLAGTPAYMAPEVVLQASQIDHRSDMYSLGATLYHSATGRPPFPRPNMTQMLLAHVNEPVKPPHEIDPFFDKGLSELICRLMAKRPQDRYNHWDDVTDAFNDLDIARAKSSRGYSGTSSSAVLQPQSLTGLVVGARFRLDRFVHADSTGTVYEGTDLKRDQERFIRVIKPDLIKKNRENFQQFTKHSESIARLEHENILRQHPISSADGMTLLITEHMEAQDLLEFVQKKHPIPIAQCIDILRQLSAGLAAAHVHGAIHRDLQPHAILISDSGNVKLTGFGLSQLASGYRSESGGVFVGALDYISPEQCQGQTLDQRADIYQFGCVAYELLTKSPPFHHENVLAALKSHVESPPPPLTEIEPRVPAELEAVILKCLAKSPDDRYQDAADLMTALAELSV